MVLADSSVWAKFYRNQLPYADEMDRLLGLGEIVAHELVYGELLIGDPGGGRKLFTAFQHIGYVKTVTHRLVVGLVQDHKLHGRGVGWIDTHLLASALAERVPLWTADEPLRALAQEFGIAYRPR